MKETAAFINVSAQNELSRVYDDAVYNKLCQTLDLTREVILAENFEEHRERLSKVSYLFATWGMPALTEKQIGEYLPNLKAVFYAAGTVQGFARPFLNRDVKVFSAWAANAVPVAEFTVAQIVLSGKGYFQGMRRMETGGREAFSAFSHSLPCNYRVKIGILGAGMIGSRVLQMLQGYDFETLAYDPFASEEKLAALGARRASLEEIFSECQVISNHIANLPATQKILRYEHFSKMKKNAVFINTGRGAQIVEDDLARALREDPDRTALLDVTWPEPPEADSPLLTLPNCILSPHIAGSMNNEVARMGAYMAEEYEALSAGRPCRYQVTLDMLETMA
ncbi:MAG TPA: hydroxyacid dehydrogenase [Candidatus Merdivicinus intestinigallinarum]|nr:hydroxyacid dehydrogenase [Candidatus Merdivicinus intestinigallinarum]